MRDMNKCGMANGLLGTGRTILNAAATAVWFIRLAIVSKMVSFKSRQHKTTKEHTLPVEGWELNLSGQRNEITYLGGSSSFSSQPNRLRDYPDTYENNATIKG